MGIVERWNELYMDGQTNCFNPDQQRLGVDVTRGPGEHLYKVTVGPTTMLMLPDDALNLCEKLLYFFKAPASLSMDLAKEVIDIMNETGLPFAESLELVKLARNY